MISCINDKKSYIPEGLRKLTHQEQLERFRNREPIDLEIVTFKNDQGEIIPLDSLSKINQENYFGDYYVNDQRQIIEIVIQLMYDGEPQIYGTQVVMENGESWNLYQLADPEYLNLNIP